MNSVFSFALAELRSSGKPTYGPISFQDYLTRANLQVKDKAPKYIAPDTLSGLNWLLRDEKLMVFRLGNETGSPSTSFALVPCLNSWDEYFFADHEIFGHAQSELYIPAATYRQLFAFTLLPRLSESGAINLAIASGLMSAALRLDQLELPYAPATGAIRASFRFQPNSGLPETVWSHTSGQVQIDAVLSAHRDGKPVVFIIEGKIGEQFDSLAKHKLLYSALALAPSIPQVIEIVPVYLRICRSESHLCFYFAECNPLERESVVAVDQLRPARVSCWRVMGF